MLDGGSNNNFIGSDGTDDDFEGNLIAGANDSVIGANVAVLGSSTFTTIVGNRIGVDATGTQDITGAFYGIDSTEDASGTIIGNEAGKGRPNVMSGHAPGSGSSAVSTSCMATGSARTPP